MSARVTITVGAPGSGKTTWARSLPPVDNIVLSLDDFRLAMFGSKTAYWQEVVPVHGDEIRGLVWQCYASALDKVLHAGWPGHIILCNTALDQKTVERDFPILQKHGVIPRLRVYDVDLDELLRRNARRSADEHVQEDYLTQCYGVLHREDAWWRTIDLPRDIVK